MVAVAVGILWGFIPAWSFYLSLLLGFGVAEGMARMVNDKRGGDLQAIGMGCIILGLVVSRVSIAKHFGISLDYFLSRPTDGHLLAMLQLRLFPDLLFAALAMLIPFVRFR